MKQIKTSSRGQNGAAVVKVDDKKGTVTVKFIEDESTYRVDLDNCPEVIQSGKFFVQMSGDEESILSVRPINGVFSLKFAGFAANEGEVPAPKEYPGGTGKSKTGKSFKYDAYLAFTALLEIQGKYEGMVFPLFLRYLFVDDGEGNTAVKGSGTNAQRLIDFLEVCGVLDDELPYKDNLLPLLEKRIAKKKKTFSAIVKNGNIDAFSSDDQDDEDIDDDEEDEEPTPKKKPVKKPVIEDDDTDEEEDEEPKKPVKKSSTKKPAKVTDDDLDDEED